MKPITLDADQLAELLHCLKRINTILGLDTQVLPPPVAYSAPSNSEQVDESYTVSLNPISNLPIPQLDENGRPSYKDVYEYIRSRKHFDPDFKKMCNEKSTAFVCQKLTNTFGWDVNDNSLRQYLGRKQKYLTLATIK